MKKLIVIIAALTIIPGFLFSQNEEIKNLFTDYGNVSEFRLTSSTSDSDIGLGLDSDLEKLFNNINEIYVLKYKGNDFKNQDLLKFQNEFKKQIEEDNYKPMIELSGDGVLKVLLKRNGNNDPSEVILIKEDENSAMYLYASE